MVAGEIVADAPVHLGWVFAKISRATTSNTETMSFIFTEESSMRLSRKLVITTKDELLAFNEYLRDIGVPEEDLITSFEGDDDVR